MAPLDPPDPDIPFFDPLTSLHALYEVVVVKADVTEVYVYDPTTGQWCRRLPNTVPPPEEVVHISKDWMDFDELLTTFDGGIGGGPGGGVPGEMDQESFGEAAGWSSAPKSTGLRAEVENPSSVNREYTAEEYHDIYGFTDNAEELYIEGGLRIEDLNLNTDFASVTVFWSTLLGLPELSDYQQLHIRTYMLPSDNCPGSVLFSKDHPAFLQLSISGDTKDVIKFLMDMGCAELSFDTERGLYELVPDRDSMTAAVYSQGAVIYEMPLE